MALFKNRRAENVLDLLSSDFTYFSESFWKNENTGETRVKFFITIVTAVISALVTLFTKNAISVSDGGISFWLIWGVSVLSLLFLLAIGFVTLRRMIKRNRVTDEFKGAMDEIRQRIKDYFDSESILEGYTPFSGSPEKKMKSSNSKDNNDKKKIEIRKFGGLSYTVAVINSFILSILGFIIVTGLSWVLLGMVFSESHPNLAIFIAVVFGFIVFAFSAWWGFTKQYNHIRNEEIKNEERIRQSNPTHAGGIVFQKTDPEPRFLLVTGKTNKDHWVFPKGHIEKGEGHGEAALREVEEEAGVMARILRPVGFLNFNMEDKGEEVKTKFYLMEYIADMEESENRHKKWLDLEKALTRLTFPDARNLLKRAYYTVPRSSTDKQKKT